MMTWEERVRAVAEHGFTDRQAGFLVTVMLHAGVCLGRHYCAFARITHGPEGARLLWHAPGTRLRHGAPMRT